MIHFQLLPFAAAHARNATYTLEQEFFNPSGVFEHRGSSQFKSFAMSLKDVNSSSFFI
jgi:hypothetical protein